MIGGVSLLLVLVKGLRCFVYRVLEILSSVRGGSFAAGHDSRGGVIAREDATRGAPFGCCGLGDWGERRSMRRVLRAIFRAPTGGSG